MDPVTPNAAAASPRRLARQLEASFAAELLQAARPSPKEGLAGRGTGAQAFDSFMDQALGEALVARGGLGLGVALERAIAARTRPAGGGPPALPAMGSGAARANGLPGLRP